MLALEGISNHLDPELELSAEKSLRLGVAVSCLRTYSWFVLL